MAQDKKPLGEVAKETVKNNPSALGDPVSLKAEKSDTKPTENDLGAKGGQGQSSGNSLKDAAMKNPSLLGDPVSLKAERSSSEPTEADRGAGRKGKGVSKL